MSTVNDVYTEVCDVLLEPLPVGLSLGLLTVSQFLDYFSQVIQEWCQRTGLVKQLVPMVASTSVGQYAVPGYAMQVQEVFYNGNYLYFESAFDFDSMRISWRSDVGTPRFWYEDRQPQKKLSLYPKPALTGVPVTATAPFYGTLSATAGLGWTASAPFYGTISAISGSPYWGVSAPLYGTLAALQMAGAGTANILAVATAKPNKIAWSLTDEILDVPDSFRQYLKYGILQRIFDQDGETRDVLRARYCGARFEEGINLAKVIADEMD